MTLKEIHDVLKTASDTLAALHLFSEDISPDTARVVGFVQGVVAMAAVVIDNDIANKADVEQQEEDWDAEQEARKDSV